MTVKQKSNHDGSYCPLVSAACGKWVGCIESECEWWTEEKNDDYSGCVLPKIYQTVKASYFELRYGSSE